MKITIADINEFQERKAKITTIGEFKALGRELRDKFSLTDIQAIDILNGRDEKILEILEKQEEKTNG